jgi:hypothetical protein
MVTTRFLGCLDLTLLTRMALLSLISQPWNGPGRAFEKTGASPQKTAHEAKLSPRARQNFSRNGNARRPFNCPVSAEVCCLARNCFPVWAVGRGTVTSGFLRLLSPSPRGLRLHPSAAARGSHTARCPIPSGVRVCRPSARA